MVPPSGKGSARGSAEPHQGPAKNGRSAPPAELRSALRGARNPVYRSLMDGASLREESWTEGHQWRGSSARNTADALGPSLAVHLCKRARAAFCDRGPWPLSRGGVAGSTRSKGFRRSNECSHEASTKPHLPDALGAAAHSRTDRLRSLHRFGPATTISRVDEALQDVAWRRARQGFRRSSAQFCVGAVRRFLAGAQASSLAVRAPSASRSTYARRMRCPR